MAASGEQMGLKRQDSMSKAKDLQNQIRRTTTKILEKQKTIRSANASLEEPTYCVICYSNEIILSPQELVAGDTSTIEFNCGHRFCAECAIADIRQHIECAEMQKIKGLDYTCQQPIDTDKIRDIFTAMNLTELFKKYERFKDQKKLDADPLVRWCVKPGCESYIRADSLEATKLTCSTCSTEICFKCRAIWHGSWTSCEDAMQKELEGWANKNKENVSLCPCCRTKIEKNQGCNHMTCAFCSYEFCWSCGASASSDDRHFE